MVFLLEVVKFSCTFASEIYNAKKIKKNYG
jgi:hypothetical protein